MRPDWKALQIEPAGSGDFAAVNGLAHQVHDLHISWRPDIFRQAEFPIPQDYFQELLARRGLYVLRSGDKILAYAVVSVQELDLPILVPRKVWKLEEICVEEAYRHQGLGRQVLEQLLAIGRSLGCTDFQLTCDPHNQAALACYEKLGMRVKVLQYQMKL